MLPTTNHLTLEEEFRITGTLTAKRFEKLLDENALAQDVIDVDANIQEAMACFPAEDFMNPVRNKVHQMMARAKGSNKEALCELLEIVNDLSAEVFNSSDYGRQELRFAMDSINRAKEHK
jgi:hypothetical protein